MNRILSMVALLIVAFTVPSAGATEHPTLLPQSFGGWQMSGSPQISRDPSVADPANAPVFKEYGFTDFESSSYVRPDRKISVKAARFADASGAYGAFTFYKQPEMLPEKIGDQGASANERILFYRGNVLVQVMFDRTTAMSAAELRELADAIPRPETSARSLPVLPGYLPKQSYIANSAKYVVGPAGLSNINAPIPAEVVDFSRNAEVVIGKYKTGPGIASLMLIYYPTPAIAGERLRAIEALNQSRPSQNFANPEIAGAITAKRTGPIVVLTAGQISPAEAKSLLASVNYDADVTWNENTSFSKRDNVANLLVNVIVLCFIIIALAFVAGIAFGGVRILVKRFFPGRVFDRPEDVEIIQLNLRKPN